MAAMWLVPEVSVLAEEYLWPDGIHLNLLLAFRHLQNGMFGQVKGLLGAGQTNM